MKNRQVGGRIFETRRRERENALKYMGKGQKLKLSNCVSPYSVGYEKKKANILFLLSWALLDLVRD